MSHVPRADVVAFLDDDAYADPHGSPAPRTLLTRQSPASAGGSSPSGRRPTGVVSRDVLLDPRLQLRGAPHDGRDAAQSRSARTWPCGAASSVRRRFRLGSRAHRQGPARLRGDRALHPLHRGTSPTSEFVLAHEAIVHHLVPPSRLTWHYFRTRCWAEGLSKAAVSIPGRIRVGPRRRAAPPDAVTAPGARQSLRPLPRHPRSATAQVALIVAGTVFAAAGLIWGKVALALEADRPRSERCGTPRSGPASLDRSGRRPADTAAARDHVQSPCPCRVAGSARRRRRARHVCSPDSWQPDPLDSGRRRCTPDVDSAPMSATGSRVWIEVVKSGHVVGLVGGPNRM